VNTRREKEQKKYSLSRACYILEKNVIKIFFLQHHTPHTPTADAQLKKIIGENISLSPPKKAIFKCPGKIICDLKLYSSK
jgi:hypothetical protein